MKIKHHGLLKFILISITALLSSCFYVKEKEYIGPSLLSRPKYDSSRFLLTSYTFTTKDYGTYGNGGIQNAYSASTKLQLFETGRTNDQFLRTISFCDALTGYRQFDLNKIETFDLDFKTANITRTKSDYYKSISDIKECKMLICNKTDNQVHSEHLPIDEMGNASGGIDYKKQWVEEDSFSFSYKFNILDYLDINSINAPTIISIRVQYFYDGLYKQNYRGKDIYITSAYFIGLDSPDPNGLINISLLKMCVGVEIIG